MISSICIASVLWYIGIRTVSSNVEFGTLVAFVAYIEMFFGPIRDLSARYTLLQSAMTGAERVFELLDNKDEDCPNVAVEEGGAPKSGRVAFALDDVSFEYKPSVPILRDVTIHANRGEK